MFYYDQARNPKLDVLVDMHCISYVETILQPGAKGWRFEAREPLRSTHTGLGEAIR